MATTVGEQQESVSKESSRTDVIEPGREPKRSPQNLTRLRHTSRLCEPTALSQGVLRPSLALSELRRGELQDFADELGMDAYLRRGESGGTAA